MRFRINGAVTCLLLFISSTVFSQVTVTNTQTASQLVQNVLIGTGISVSNITLNGNGANAGAIHSQIGYFEDGSSTFPIARGVVMSTGNISTLPGTANQFSSSNGPSNMSDPDLVTISGVSINDAMILEFDFVATGDSMRFNYMFGSEEYPEFVGSTVNDAFGFFLSGPGINGPYANNAINIALIPGTTTPVSINTVNQNLNTAYYQDNSTNIYGSSTQLDGYTVLLVAASNLICGATYHIKLAIGDGGDSVYDSAVFLQAESFTSNVVTIEAKSTIVGSTFTDTLMAEGCTATNLIFSRPAYLADTTQEFYITFSGTADPYLDFSNLQDTIVFAPGVDTVSYLITPIDDGLTEPMEWLKIYGYTITVCGDTIYDSLTLYIVDSYNLTFDLQDTLNAVCVPHEPTANITNLQGSVGPFDYSWSTGDSTATVNLPNNGFQPDTITHYVTVTDGCGDTFLDSVVLIVDSLTPSFTVSPGYDFESHCITDVPTATATLANTTIPPYTFSWSTGTNGPTSSLPNNGINFDTIYYTITLTDGCGNSIVDSVRLTTDYEVPEFTISPNDTLYAPCPSSLVQANLALNFGTFGPYIHDWSDGQSGIPVQLGNNGQFGGQQWYYVTSTNACGMSTIDSVLVINNFVQPQMSILPNDTIYTDCIPDSALAYAQVTNNAVGPYTYTWSNGVVNDSTYFFDNGVNGESIPFSVTVTDGCGFTTTENGVLIVNQTLKIDDLTSYPSAACDPTGYVSGMISGQTPPGQGGVQYEWTGPGPNNPNSINASVWSDLGSGWYYFTATDQVCSVSDSIFVDVQDPPIAAGTVTPSSGTAPLTVTFNNQSQNTNNYYWDFGNGQTQSTNSTNPINQTYSDTGTYTIMLVSYQSPTCSDTIYLTVVVSPPPPIPPIPPIPPFGYELPNVFSPNGDDVNDVFSLNAVGMQNVELRITNRWGNVCFEGSGANPGWDGIMPSGNPATEGVYFYQYIIVTNTGETISGQAFLHLRK